MKKKVLVTGGDGDIARAISKIFSVEYTVLSPNKKELNVTNNYRVEKYMNENKPDIIINCAGVIYPDTIIDGKVNKWLYEIDVNLIGSYLVSKHGISNGCECIINIGSSAGSNGKAGWSGYCASKRALVSLTESIYEEGTCCLCISAGRTDTKMRQRLFPNEAKDQLLTPQEFAKKVYDFYTYRNIIGGKEIIVRKNIEGDVECYMTKICTERIV